MLDDRAEPHEPSWPPKVVDAHPDSLGRLHGCPCSRPRAGFAYPWNVIDNDTRPSHHGRAYGASRRAYRGHLPVRALTRLASQRARVAPGPLAHVCAGDPLAVAAAGGYWGIYSMTDAVGGILLGGA